LRLQVLVQLLEAGELRCEAALGGCVDDEDDFVVQLGQVVGLALLYYIMLAGRPVQGRLCAGGVFADGRATYCPRA
jgi:hypothetical protein